MTFRAKPPRRRSFAGDDDARRQRIVTIGFIVVSLVAVAILGASVAYGFYRQHFAPVARVGNTEISRDQWLNRIKVDNYKLSVFEARVRESAAQGDISMDTANVYFQQISSQQQQLPSQAIEQLIDDTLQAQLAPQLNVTVTDAEVDAAIQKGAAVQEERHVLVIAVDPLLVDKTPAPGETVSPTATPTASPSPTPSGSPGASPTVAPSPTASPTPAPTTATAAQIAKAKARAEAALAKLKSGIPFSDVAIQYSTDTSGPTGGDLGFMIQDGAPDATLGTALWKLPPQGTTDVIEGKDHIMWIGRVTEIRPATQDTHFLDGLAQNGIDLASYRASVRADTLKQKMTAALVAQDTNGPTDQVHPYEIQIMVNPDDPTAVQPEVHALHILYAPNGDPNKASTVPDNDPAWTAAQQKAQKTADALRAIADPTFRQQQFEATAKTDSNDSNTAATGGDLSWLTRASLERPFGDAIFDGQHSAGEIIGPVKTSFGWHVILYLAQRAGPKDRIAAIREQVTAPGADFVAIARQVSEGTDASRGGDMGWIAKYQLAQDVEKIVFGLQAGQVSDVITDSAGLHLYFVKERQQRAVDPDQLTTLKSSAFSNWYDPQKAAATIWRDTELLGQTPVPAST